MGTWWNETWRIVNDISYRKCKREFQYQECKLKSAEPNGVLGYKHTHLHLHLLYESLFTGPVGGPHSEVLLCSNESLLFMYWCVYVDSCLKNAPFFLCLFQNYLQIIHSSFTVPLCELIQNSRDVLFAPWVILLVLLIEGFVDQVIA